MIDRLRNSFRALLVCAGAALVLTPTAGFGVGVVYPAAGQSPEQQRKDEFECQSWARSQTGFDPNQPPPRVYADAPASSGYQGSGFGSGEVGQGGMVRDGARGAALGAIGGAIAGDAGKGAAIGAASGALFGGIRRSNRKQQERQWQAQQQAQLRQQQAQLDQQYAAARNRFMDAVSLCLSSRNYNVR